jgi:hypothetical protein
MLRTSRRSRAVLWFETLNTTSIMRGPFRPGTFRSIGSVTHWERCVVRGNKYRVITEFDDADGAFHSLGEEWFFLGSYFVPYDDDLTIFIATDNGHEWKLPLCWRSEMQLDVCENFAKYVVQTSTPRRDDYFSTSVCAECHQPLDGSEPKKCLACGAVWN